MSQRRTSLVLVPMSLDEANAFVVAHHRKLGAVRGHKWSIGAELDGELVGVVIVGRPNARELQDGYTVEVTRLCTIGTRNACSFLYGAAVRAAKSLGYRRVGTYIGKGESGVSLKAAGWRLIWQTRAQDWDRPSRRRTGKHQVEPRLRFEPAPDTGL